MRRDCWRDMVATADRIKVKKITLKLHMPTSAYRRSAPTSHERSEQGSIGRGWGSGWQSCHAVMIVGEPIPLAKLASVWGTSATRI